jgi:hypothetical protein
VFTVLGGITIPALIAFVIALFAKPKCIMQIVPDINHDGLYILYKQAKIVVLTSKLWITYDRHSEHIDLNTNPREVNQELYRHFFWLNPEFEKTYQVTDKINYIWVKPIGRSPYYTLSKYYRVKFDERGMVSGYIEYIGSTNGNTQSMRDIRIAGNNQNATTDLPQPILRYLSEHSGF